MENGLTIRDTSRDFRMPNELQPVEDKRADLETVAAPDTLDRVTSAIVRDSQTDTVAYLNETAAPHGGE